MSYKPEERLSKYEFWEDCYVTEIENFENNQEDIGEVWFGESIAEEVAERSREFISLEKKILDVGCGNGYTLSLLAQEGYTNLYGMDYSPSSIILTRKVLEKDDVDMTTVILEEMDILKEDCLNNSQIKEMDVVIADQL